MLSADHAAMNAGVSPLTCVSTDGVKASERRELWEASAGPLFGALRLDQPTRSAFNARLEYTRVADLIFCQLSARVPHRVVRTGAFARQDDRATVKVILQGEGQSVVEQYGRNTLLHRGQWSIYDTSDPYSITIPFRSEMYLLMIPRERIFAPQEDIRNLVVRRFCGRRGLGKLIWTMVATTFDQMKEIRNRSGHDVADVIARMIRLALLDASGERAPADSREALRDRIKMYISSHLGDPDLSLDKLAHATGCTKRYLHMAFQPETTSISDYIVKLRLERCREDLVNPANARRSITEIAYCWGFNNSNHFSRRFKQAFGVSPRRSRAGFASWLTAAAVSGGKPA